MALRRSLLWLIMTSHALEQALELSQDKARGGSDQMASYIALYSRSVTQRPLTRPDSLLTSLVALPLVVTPLVRHSSHNAAKKWKER
jgi:hypothetical protein